MVLWYWMFWLKLALGLWGSLKPLWWVNVLLLGLVLLKHQWFKTRRFKPLSWLIELTLLIPMGLALSLHELGLGVNAALLQQIWNLTGFSVDYLWELTQRTVQPSLMWGGLLGLLLLTALHRYVRLSTWTLLALLVGSLHHSLLLWQSQVTPPVQITEDATGRQGDHAAARVALGPKAYAELDWDDPIGLNANGALQGPQATLAAFVNQQKQLLAQWAPGQTEAVPFDILMLHICSVSWADIQYAKLSSHPLLTQADLVFQQFNTVSSYSGPASLRLLRGSCGQSTHNSLYQNADPRCLTFGQLKQAGYKIELGLNHNGVFDNFRKTLLNNMPADTQQPVSPNGLPVGVKAFDGSSATRDEDYLLAWWNKRLAQPDSQARALYYNTITLHDGNLLPGSNATSMQTYPQRLERLMDDLQSLLRAISRSDRRALVLIIPEHGANLSGARGQLPGLREIPTPEITLAPVLAYWIAPGAQRRTGVTYPVTVRQPVSYLAINELMNQWVRMPEAERLNPDWPVLVGRLPSTPFVAEEGETTVLDYQNRYWIKAPGADWGLLKD